MTARSLIRLAIALFLVPAPSGAQATVFKSSNGSLGDVWVYPGPGQGALRPPELQGIRLLTLDATGRSVFTQFQPDQARLKSDVPFGTRLLLPEEQGSLYRYRKDGIGGSEFGYFIVRPNGMASFLASFPGTGSGGTVDPIPNPVALSAEGDAMLLATTVAAGGDVLEIELTTGAVHMITPGVSPLEVLPQGLALQTNWGVALTTRGPLRFARGGHPLIVPLNARTQVGRLGQNRSPTAGQPLNYFGNGIAKSADGSTVAVIAGTAADQAHVFTFRLAGQAVCVNDTPAPIADPGFGTQAGPTLALAEDGSRAAWKTLDQQSGECFSRIVPSVSVQPELQITANQRFGDTLNDTGVIAFFGRNKVAMMVGETNGAGGVERADFYQVTFPSGGGAPAIVNMTNTSGDTTVPFLSKGDLETSDGCFQIPGQSGFVYFVPYSSGQGEVYRMNPATGVDQLIASGIAQFDLIERVGTSFVVQIQHDLDLQHELMRIPFDHSQPAQSLGVFATSLASHAGNAAGTFAGVFNTGGSQRLLQVSPSGSMTVLPDSALFAPTLGFDGSGAVLAVAMDALHAYLFSWSAAGSAFLYDTGPTQSYVLPAN